MKTLQDLKGKRLIFGPMLSPGGYLTQYYAMKKAGLDPERDLGIYSFPPGAWTPERESRRRAVNAWIRDDGAFDAVVDFDKALRDPDHPTRMLPIYDCGDHLHPSDLGYTAMGDAVDLSLFD